MEQHHASTTCSLQTLVSLLNLGARKAGLGAPPDGERAERDLEQVAQAIDGARALLPVLEPRHGERARAVRDALSQLQMAYVQRAGGAAPAPRGRAAEPQPEPRPAPARRSAPGGSGFPGSNRRRVPHPLRIDSRASCRRPVGAVARFAPDPRASTQRIPLDRLPDRPRGRRRARLRGARRGLRRW